MLFRQIVAAKLAQYAYLLGCQRAGEVLVTDRSSVAAAFPARKGLEVELIDDAFSADARTGELEKSEALQAR